MKLRLVGAAVFGFGCLAHFPARATEVYRLGPGDHVEVKVSDFRSATGEAYQWTAFNSATATEFIVAPDGRLSLPVVGELEAAGKTTADLERSIADKLQTKAGLTTKPDAAVQIVKFRPFYVVGIVDKPGEYDYRPGLTVLQAVGIAGGLERTTTDALLGFIKDTLISRGDVRVLAADLISLRARQARLDAETAEKDTIAFPNDLLAKSDDPDVARAMREEQILFDAQRTGLANQVATIEKNKAFLHNEIASLGQKSDTIAAQLAAMRKELDLISGLVSKGLTAAPRQLELEQNLAQIQNNQLDVQVAIVRANEDISKSDRDILELQTKSRNDELTEAADVRVKLAETMEKMQTSQALVRQAEVRAPMETMTNVEGYGKPIYVLSRRDDKGQAQELTVQESELVQPGDVVRALPRLTDTTPSSAASPGSPAPARVVN
jgi:protein involved in polysaccharide export with SLBB domain